MTIKAQPGATIEVSVAGFASGLAGTIGLRVVDPILAVDTIARSAAGVVEAPAGSGIYHKTVVVPAAKKYGLVWDTGSVTPASVAEEDLISGPESTAPSRVILLSAVGFATGLVGTIGVQIIDPPAGTVMVARTPAGISEYPAGSGIYWRQGVAPATAGQFAAVWDNNGTPKLWAIDDDPLLVALFAAPPAGGLNDLINCTVSDLDDCHMYRGDTRYFPFAITHSDTGLPFDLTGASMWFTAKDEVSDPDPGQFQQTIINGKIVITNAAGGIGYVRVDPIDTVTMGDGDTTLLWDLQIKTSAADTPVTTVARGTIIVRGDITKAI